MDLSEEEILKSDARYVTHGIGKIPMVVVEGKGAIIKDIKGNEILDCVSGTSGPVSVGYTHPRVVEAVKKQVEQLSHSLALFANIPRTELAERLASIAPSRLRGNCVTYFSTGGSEANEVALKFAMLTKKKAEAVSVFYSYHGGTLATLSLCGQSWTKLQYPRFPGFYQIPNAYCYRCAFGKEYPGCDFECARYLEYQLKLGSGEKNVAAFILETVQGNGGHMHPPTPEYFKIVREICDKQDVLFIIDEVQTGLGRTGEMWSCDYFKADPDILTCGKTLSGGGSPVAATSIRSDLVPREVMDDIWHIFSMGGSPLGCACGVAALDILRDEKLPERAAETGRYMTKRLEEMYTEHPLIGEIRGPGLLIGVELVKDRRSKEPGLEEAMSVQMKSFQKGVLFGLSAKPRYGNVIKIKPPLNLTKEQADTALNTLDDALKEVKAV